MESREGKEFEYWLHNLPGIGDRTIEKLLSAFGNARRIYEASAAELEMVLGKKEPAKGVVSFKKAWDLQGEYEELLKKDIAFLTAEDKAYPEKLRKLAHPPFGVYCRGRMPPEEKPAVAVIGARECSQYGVYMAEAFGKALAEAGVSVISGMARGIDGISQQAALSAGGCTWAVLGCGVDVCYPASNRSLYEQILEKKGGILSVVPPGTEPIKRLFPERNRIVAGLCDVLLVVEARQKSGTWITVDMALEQGKSVYAIPGRLTDRLSDGCNMLIKQGAGVALSPEDVLAEIAVLWNRKGRIPTDTKENVIQKEEKITSGILRYLDYNPKSSEEIWSEMLAKGEGKTLPEVLNQLVELCIQGRAKQVAGNYFIKTGN